MSDKKYILTQAVAAQKLQRMALEIAEQLDGDDAELAIIGIQHNGMVIAQKMASLIQPYLSATLVVLSLQLNKQQPMQARLDLNGYDLNKKNIILVDDVINSGRTLLYALQPLLPFYPKRIQTLVLVERMHKLFPVKPDYVGLSLATTLQDHIEVEVSNGEVLGAYF